MVTHYLTDHMVSGHDPPAKQPIRTHASGSRESTKRFTGQGRQLQRKKST
jgi:hypothetical protein